MKVIIAGSRWITNPELIEWCINESEFEITEVVCGNARGVDTLGADWARAAGIPVREFLADWDGLGNKAGIVRNCEMAIYGEGLIAVWDRKSKGTKHMIKAAKARDLKVYVYKTPDPLQQYRDAFQS